MALVQVTVTRQGNKDMWFNTDNVAYISPAGHGEWNVTMNNNMTFTVGEADAGRLFAEITVRSRD
jgi:hypothetical protein